MRQRAIILIIYGMLSMHAGAQLLPAGGYGKDTVRLTCKNFQVADRYIFDTLPVQRRPSTYPSSAPASPWLKIHGNILYDLNYRSNVDTPYAEKDVYQHTVQTYLDITVKDNYPFRVYFTTRFSNSSLFRDFSNMSLLYNASDFNRRVKRQVQNLLQQRPELDSLARMNKLLTDMERKFYLQQHLLDSTAWIQRIIAAREERWLKERARESRGSMMRAPVTKDSLSAGLPGLPDIGLVNKYKFSRAGSNISRGKDSTSGSVPDTAGLQERYESAKRKLDSLRGEIDSLRKRYQEVKEWQGGNTSELKKELDGISSGSELKKKLNALHISDSTLPKGYQTLYSVRSFGIGRTLLNYSELSARNVSINGVQMEYNPSTYMAVAVGTVDYRFRDYTMENPLKGQYIALLRYGWGKKEGNNVILTYYTGRRQLYNSYTNIQGADIPNYHLMGFTVEGHYRINRTSTFTAEVAKSSSPYYSQDSSRPHHVLSSALKMNDHTNEAWAVKLNTFLPYTQTQLDASYRRYGANFQSFSLFTSGAAQSSWSVKVDQPFFRRRLLMTGSIRTNDFTNPLVNAAYKSSTVFKSIQATWRQKNWPTLSAGYFPSSQLTKIGNDQYQENMFYTVTAAVTHTYKVRRVSFIGMLMYTQFYNKATDSNFVYFNTKNLLLSQSAFIGPLTVQTQLSAAMNNNYDLYTIDNRADFRVCSWLSVGAGVKYNKQTVYNLCQWGYSGNAAIRVPVIGEFRLMADKGFIPGNNRQLVPNNLGRLTYSKVF